MQGSVICPGQLGNPAARSTWVRCNDAYSTSSRAHARHTLRLFSSIAENASPYCLKYTRRINLVCVILGVPCSLTSFDSEPIANPALCAVKIDGEVRSVIRLVTTARHELQ